MNKVILDSRLLELKNMPAGFISGLKKLQGLGFAIESPGFNKSGDEVIKRIMDLEGIKIKSKRSGRFERSIDLSLSGSKGGRIKLSGYEADFTGFTEAVEEIVKSLRFSHQRRKTKETDIEIKLSLDGRGESVIDTGLGFFNHMLEQIAKHANVNLEIKVNGDLEVDEHHTVEDTGITLGNAISEALGDKRGIKRYGFMLPMDEAAAICAIDLSGRTYLNFKCNFKREAVGDFPTELAEEFFRGLASGMKANIYIRGKGKNDHHKIEGMFKAFAKSLNEACRFDERNEGNLPSTKGIL